jgi:two-component sensor histidine kinase
VGAPGVAWGTGAPCRKTDFWEMDANGQYSRRATAARHAGIRTVCAVPVHGPSGVVAVIEIGGSHRYPGYDRLPDLLEEVGQSFGSFVARFRSQRAFQALFHHSPDALLVVDESGVVRSSSARAEAVFGGVVGAPLGAVLDQATASLSPEAGEGPHELLARRADGTTFVAEVTVSRTTATGAQSDIVAIRDLTERRRIEEALRRTLADKVVLVQEVHHRVKNNLQVLSSLVSLQADALNHPAVHGALRDTANRIQSMALVHQQLYAHDDLTRIRFDDYARSLCSALRTSLAPTADLGFEGDAVEVAVERAVPAGLVLNELVTNAFKHGLSPSGGCVVRVRVLRTEEGFAFVVSDEGPGLGAATPREGSMGATLIRALTRQLRARHEVLAGVGTTIRVNVPNEG